MQIQNDHFQNDLGVEFGGGWSRGQQNTVLVQGSGSNAAFLSSAFICCCIVDGKVSANLPIMSGAVLTAFKYRAERHRKLLSNTNADLSCWIRYSITWKNETRLLLGVTDSALQGTEDETACSQCHALGCSSLCGPSFMPSSFISVIRLFDVLHITTKWLV